MLDVCKNTNGYKWVRILLSKVTYYTYRMEVVTCRIFPGRESRKAPKGKSKKDDMKKVMVTIYTNASQTNIHTAIRILAKIVGAKMIEIMQIESELPEIKKNNN